MHGIFDSLTRKTIRFIWCAQISKTDPGLKGGFAIGSAHWGPNQPALFFLSSRDHDREVPLFPAWGSSSNRLVRAVVIASPLMRFKSCFFLLLGRPPCFLRPRISVFIWSYCSSSGRIKQNSPSEILSSVSAVEILSAIVFIFDRQGPGSDRVFLPSLGASGL